MSKIGLNNFLKKYNLNISEGFSQQNLEQCTEIKKLLNKDQKYIMEIGFNAGHSSELFLENTNAYIYSFDIGLHFNEYLKYGKTYINKNYPNRHTLVFGNSKESVPRFFKNHQDIKFDVIFIDGGHDYDVALADLLNSKNMAHENTILIVDDVIKNNPDFVAGYTIGPTQAWNECLNKNIITETAVFEWSIGRGMTVGKYVFN